MFIRGPEAQGQRGRVLAWHSRDGLLLVNSKETSRSVLLEATYKIGIQCNLNLEKNTKL